MELFRIVTLYTMFWQKGNHYGKKSYCYYYYEGWQCDQM